MIEEDSDQLSLSYTKFIRDVAKQAFAAGYVSHERGDSKEECVVVLDETVKECAANTLKYIQRKWK